VIALSAWERFKGGQRLEFVCGGRALTKFRSLRDAASASGRLLSVLTAELPAAIERLQADAKDHKRAIAAQQSELAVYQARDLAASAEIHPRGRLVFQDVAGDANVLKSLATTITAQPGFIVVLVTRSNPALVVAARSSDVSVSSQEIVSSLTKQFGGRGGGKPDLAQGGGLTGEPASILESARALL
jgi:alanyl-tRNA synthetase